MFTLLHLSVANIFPMHSQDCNIICLKSHNFTNVMECITTFYQQVYIKENAHHPSKQDSTVILCLLPIDIIVIKGMFCFSSIKYHLEIILGNPSDFNIAKICHLDGN